MTSPSVQEEAVYWFMQLQDAAANSDSFLAWQRWLSASDEHACAFREIEETVLLLATSSAKPALPSLREMAVDTYDGSQPIEEWERSREDAGGTQLQTLRRRRPGSVYRYAVAAGLTALIAVGAWQWNAHPPQLGIFTYRTTSGEQRSVQLADGSRVTLDADSALAVELTHDRRSLTLRQGEAYFQVAKDSRRPFIVSTGSARVTAIGTAFNLRISEDRTIVAVTEGKVEFVGMPEALAHTTDVVDPPDLRGGLTAQVTAGEAVSYHSDGNLQALSAHEVPLATAWLEGSRQYRNEPLRYVLTDVDRYTGQRIEVTDAKTGDLRFTGTLNLANSEAWLKGLTVALPVKIISRPDGSLLVKRNSPSPAVAR